MEQLQGTGVALVTPFRKDFSVDTEALERIVGFCINGGIDYLVVLGTTGESVTLNKSEKQLVIDTVVKTNGGRLPLVLGLGGSNTAALVEEIQQTDLINFDAILSVSPYYNRPSQEGIYQHFKAVSQASSKPIILYNVPGRTGSNMLPATTLRLANEFENIVAIKEACGDITQIMQIIKEAPKGFQVISGDDITALPTVLAGGAGVISVLGQGTPSELSQMIKLGMEGRVKEAFDLHYKLMDAMSLIFLEGNPAGIKAVFESLKISTATVRLPLMEATPELKSKINNFLNTLSKVHA